MGLSAAQCLVLEDSANGYQAAQAAQLATVITVNAYTRDHDFPGALSVLSDLGEPTAPAQVLAGATWVKQPWVDVATLRTWLAH
jgi:beta-phosphoglucomutase-like phosphatase (HAD superfamily)